MAGYAGLGRRAGRPLPATTDPAAGRPRRRSTAGSSPPASSGCRWPAAGPAATGPGGRIMPVDELAIPGRHNVSNALAAVAVGAPVRRRARRDPARPPAAFTGVEHRLEPVARRRRRALRQRLAGHPARRGDRRAARVRAADRADRRRPRQGRRPARARRRSSAERAAAAVLIGESGPDLEALLPRRRPGPDRAGRADARARPSRPRDALARDALAPPSAPGDGRRRSC